ncbi:MAG: HAD family hydrolase [Planctomycetota bacterium]|nr:MAG: HAD family hydrolase [Planctomycetota bacterium]
MIKTVLFDMDGVLIDSYRAWFEVVNAAACHYGKKPVTREQFAEAWGQSTEADVEKFFQGCTILELEKYYQDHFAEYSRYITVMPGAKEVLAELKNLGVRTAIITNTWTPLAEEVLDKLEIEPDVLVGDGDVEHSKPAPDMIYRACELLGVELPDAIFIGDSDYDLQAARAAGVRFLGFKMETSETIQKIGEILEYV